MIHDFVIIKDGLPLLVKNFSNIQKLFVQEDKLIMISGFFSALNSFSDSFEDLGTISELKLSRNDLKLSFLKEKRIPNLIYLATYDDKTNISTIQMILNKVSTNFLKEFNIDQISNWTGKMDSFNSFIPQIEKYIKEDNEIIKVPEKKESASPVEEANKKETNKSVLLENNSEFEIIPKFTASIKIDPKVYLTGDTSCSIYNKIDGIKSINQISQELKLTQDKVYSICKNLTKMGFIDIR